MRMTTYPEGTQCSRRCFSWHTSPIQVHSVLLPNQHWISLLVTRYIHQRGHDGVAITAEKMKVKYWIQEVRILARSVKFECVTCREIAKRVEKTVNV